MDRRPARRLRAPLIATAAALVALFALPAAASARWYTLGSDLKAPATIVEHHGADTTFWNVQIAGSPHPTVAPEGGQVTEVKVKGSLLEDPRGQITPNPIFHTQTLHPMGDGTMLVELSSTRFYLPVGGNPDVINTYRPLNMCLHQGDYLDLRDIGGFQYRWGRWRGMPYQVFGHVPGSVVNLYTADNGTNNGSRWAPAAVHQDEELLMQMKFATGPDATDICPGGYKQHVYTGISFRNAAVLRTVPRILKVRFVCPGRSYGSCKGTLTVSATLGGQKVVLGRGGFDVRPSYDGNVEMVLSSANALAIQRAGGVAATVVASSHDNPSKDRRVRWTIPVQYKTNTAPVQVQPDH